MRQLVHLVTQAEEGAKVSTLLRAVLGLSGSAVKRAKAIPGGITLDGAPVPVSAQVRPGQSLAVQVGDREGGSILPAEGPLNLRYEDEDILILDKPAGVAVHPGPGHYEDTVGNFLAYRFLQKGIPFVFRPVNRLDRGTSGLMAVALHAHAHETIKRQLHTPAFRRIYLAVCEGELPAGLGVVDAPIGRAEGSALRRCVSPSGAPARTHYQVLHRTGGSSLVRLELETGRTHQIRVHMAHLGCPLTGDFLYGVEDKAVIGRTALHAAELTLCHPVTGERLALASPLPADMARLVPGWEEGGRAGEGLSPIEQTSVL